MKNIKKKISENFHFLVVKFSIYTERKKKRRVNFIPKFHSSLKQFFKYFTMITKRYMYGTVHVWNKSSKFHWFVINKSRVIEVHW